MADYAPHLDSNTSTSGTPFYIKKTINEDGTYDRPLQLDKAMITKNGMTGEKSARLTGYAEIVIKPNSKSAISATIPPDTTVTGHRGWNGKIMPPIVKDATMIMSRGEPIEGVKRKLTRDDVDVIVKAGSIGNVSLNFSNPVLLEIPTDLPDGTNVSVLFSQDKNIWKVLGATTVANGIFRVVTDQLGYFTTSATLADELGEIPLMDIFVKKTILSAEKTVSAFQDIAEHWAEDYIEQIIDLGIVGGKTPTSFAPDDYITRAEITKIAMEAFKLEHNPIMVTSFTDIKLDDWHATYIEAATKAGWVQGYDTEWNTKVFNPNLHLNRTEALEILLEAAGFEISEDITANLGDTATGTWCTKYVNFASKNGIVDGYFDSESKIDNDITRAEVAKIVIKILDLKN